MVAKKSRSRKPVKSLAARRLTAKQAKRVKGGGLPPAANTVSAGVITGVGVPALDAAGKDAAKMTTSTDTNLYVRKLF
jgi:hypothetical protein